MLEQDWRLGWGGLLLAAPEDEEYDTPYRISALADGSDLGNPVKLFELLRSLLSDGSLAVVHGWDNRTITLGLVLEGDDGEGLAKAEAALMAEVIADDPAPLIWTAPMYEAAPCVFDVVTVADFRRGFPEGWDLSERRDGERYFTVVLSCLPWVRPEDTTVMRALSVSETPATPTSENIDTCDSFSGWNAIGTPGSSWSGVGGSSSGGYVEAEGVWTLGPVGNKGNLVLTRTGAVAMGSTPYLVVDVKAVPIQSNYTSKTVGWSAKFDGGVKVAPVAKVAGTDGRTLLYFIPPSSFTEFKVFAEFTSNNTAYHGFPSMANALWFRIFNVARSDGIAISGSTARQQAREVDVLGSAPTTAALRLFTDEPSDTLGRQILIYSRAASANGWQPPLRRWMFSAGTVTNDAARISGSRNTLASAMSFLIPAEQLEPATYGLIAYLSKAITGMVTIDWTAKITDLAGVDVLGSEYVASGSTRIEGLTPGYGYALRSLASITLPTVALDDPTNYAVKITLSMIANGADITIDEAWLCDTDNGTITLIDLPSTAAVSWVEIRSAELDAPLPGVFAGTGGSALEGGQSVARHAAALGVHRFLPGTMRLFTAVSGSLYTQSELEFYPRGHSSVEFGSDELP